MSKIYLKENVYEAAQKRLDLIFRDFEKIIVAFSGGKDSGVLLNLAVEHARLFNKKIAVMFIDLEAQYRMTIEYVERVFRTYADCIEPYWICLPLNLRNAVSVYQPFWCAWEPGLEDKWVRKMPLLQQGLISEQSFFPFWRYRMEFEMFTVDFSRWYSGGEKTATLIGIRSDESLNRWRTIASETKDTYKGHQWTTRLNDSSVYNCYPLYDWRTEDIWTANGKRGWDYNRLYDIFCKAGVSIHEMRICQPYGDDQRIGLNLFRVIEPETWARVVNRVSGANYGNIYCGTKALGYRGVQLPKGHTWKSYTKLLLSSLPPETRANYVERFKRFMTYWHRKGCGLPDDCLSTLPNSAVVTKDITNKGNKNKKIVKYKGIEDSAPGHVESKKHAPTWRRMAICILKNDHLCKGLSFAQTKYQVERQKQLIEKYRNI